MKETRRWNYTWKRITTGNTCEGYKGEETEEGKNFRWWYRSNTCVRKQGSIGLEQFQTKAHFSEKLCWPNEEFPSKAAHQRNFMLDKNGLALFHNFCFSSMLDRSEPAMLIRWLWAVQGKHELSFYRAGTRSCQSTCPHSRYTGSTFNGIFHGISKLIPHRFISPFMFKEQLWSP